MRLSRLLSEQSADAANIQKSNSVNYFNNNNLINNVCMYIVTYFSIKKNEFT
jgi:hypothetical protein